ncbi:MAG: serine hydrolase domain-containing protein [Pseudomonadota bacterium]
MPDNVNSRRTYIDGYCHEDFQDVDSEFLRQLKLTPGGAAICVYHHGERVVDLWGGYRDESGSLWLKDTMAPSFSTTKGVCSTLLHIFADRGQVDYDEPVASYWPEFGQAGKENITVRQVMTHQSGMYHIRQMIDSASRMLDWQHIIRAIEQASPVHEPGTRAGYHGLTYGFIIGEILQRVSGQLFAELVQQELAQPLGLDGLYVGAPESELHRAASLFKPRGPGKYARRLAGHYLEFSLFGANTILKVAGIDSQLSSFHDALAPKGMRNFDFGAAETLRVSIPAGNGLFTARSLSAMYAMLAESGTLNGVRVLSDDTAQQLSVIQPAPEKLAVMPINMRWRLGYHGVYSNRGFQASAFGHFGWGGSGAWADPTQNLSFGMITNSGGGTPFGDSRISRLSEAARSAARLREPPARLAG